MSFKAVTTVMHCYEAGVELSHQELALLMGLANYADDSGQCFPGRTLLGKVTRLHGGTLTRALRSAASRGLIAIEARYRKDGGGQTSNVYTINLALLSGGKVGYPPIHSGEGGSRKEGGAPPETGQGGLPEWRASEPQDESQDEPPPPGNRGGGGFGSSGSTTADSAMAEAPAALLKRLGVMERSIGRIVGSVDSETIRRKTEDFQAALDAGAKIGPALLADALLNGREIERPPAKAAAPAPVPVRFYRYQCVGCGDKSERSSPPDRWPTCPVCRDALLFLPATPEAAARWAREIAQVERLRPGRPHETPAGAEVCHV